MSLLTIFFTLLCYSAAAIFAFGTLYKMWRYIRTPQRLRIPITPAPTTHSGVALRLGKEIFFFASLFKSSKWTWLFGWTFHVAFLIVLLRHAHYFFVPAQPWMFYIQDYSGIAAFLLIASLIGLWARRIVIDRVRYISAPSDHLMLALIIGIAVSGVIMKKVALHNMLAARNFVRGLIEFDWQPFPPDTLMIVHFSLIATLLIIYPFSKLLHAPGIVFNPALNQQDNAR